MSYAIISKKYEDYFIIGLRIALGLIFVWFGALKVFGFNPVYSIVAATFPIFATELGNNILGALETAIGIGLLFNIFPMLIYSALILHLFGTLATFIIAPNLMFHPYFPILTLEGEFVFKNVALATAGLAVLGYHRSRHTE